MVAALAYVYLTKEKDKSLAFAVGQTAAGTAIDLVDGVVSETVFTVGEKIGVPRTNPEKCAAAKAAGEKWNASLYCPGTDFFKWLVN